jgi:hypothetical protein
LGDASSVVLVAIGALAVAVSVVGAGPAAAVKGGNTRQSGLWAAVNRAQKQGEPIARLHPVVEPGSGSPL